MFDSQDYSSDVKIHTHNGVTTVGFTNTGQTFEITGVKTLHFADGTNIHI
jgi:hypothetical protein